MKKNIVSLFLLVFGLFLLAGCGEKTEEKYYDNEPTEIDHYFSNQISFADTGTSLKKNTEGKYEGKFIADKVAKLKLKSVTDGDTAVFHLNGEMDTYTSSVNPNGYSYLTIRFLCVDTPESTSSIDPWGKKASTYAKELLENAEGIIVDASDLENNEKYTARLDSNGTRWLGLIWYCPSGGNPEDLSQYRLYQLDLIEECYSHCTGSLSTNRYAYTAKKASEPILYSRYEESYGSLKLGEVLYEAELRMADLGLRIHGETDDAFDYSKTPTSMTITDALKNIDEYMAKGTFVELTGVITRFVGNNFYFEDEKGTALYVYMGISGKSINRMFKQGDTIKIRGRLCSYGGQYQMSGIEFKEETFTKVTGADAIAMPEPTAITGKETKDELTALIGKLVTSTFTLEGYNTYPSKDGSYTMYSSVDVDYLVNAGAQYTSLNIRINGTLAPGYKKTEFTENATYTVTGILSVYSEMDLQNPSNFPSYQIVPGNRPVDSEGNAVSEIVLN